MKCWNVNLVTAPHRQAGHFCPLEVMPVKDGAGPNEGGKKSGCEMFFFSLWVSHLWIPAHRSLRGPELTHPPAISQSLEPIPPNLPFTHILLCTLLSP